MQTYMLLLDHQLRAGQSAAGGACQHNQRQQSGVHRIAECMHGSRSLEQVAACYMQYMYSQCTVSVQCYVWLRSYLERMAVCMKRNHMSHQGW